jgi:hypothetical protein
MNDIEEITAAAPTAQVARPTLHLTRSAPNAELRVRSRMAQERPVVRLFPGKDFDRPKSAAVVTSDAPSRPAPWIG